MRVRSLTTALLPLAAIGPLAGCVSWRSLQPVPPSVAAARQLARQGVAAMEVGQWQEAEQLLASAVEKTPEDPEAQRYLAEALWQRGEHRQALEHMAKAASLDTADVQIAVRAGEMLLESGEPHRAIRLADRAIRIDNSLATAWTLRGRAYAGEGELDRALADFQRSLLLAPNDAAVLMETAGIYHQRGQHERCLATLHRLQDNHGPDAPDTGVLELEAETYLALGRPQLAAERVALAVNHGGMTAQRRTLEAQAHRQMGVEISRLPPPAGNELR